MNVRYDRTEDIILIELDPSGPIDHAEHTGPLILHLRACVGTQILGEPEDACGLARTGGAGVASASRRAARTQPARARTGHSRIWVSTQALSPDDRPVLLEILSASEFVTGLVKASMQAEATPAAPGSTPRRKSPYHAMRGAGAPDRGNGAQRNPRALFRGGRGMSLSASTAGLRAFRGAARPTRAGHPAPSPPRAASG